MLVDGKHHQLEQDTQPNRNRRLSNNSQTITRYLVVLAITTFITYGTVHANRKSFSVIKVLIVEEWSPYNKVRFANKTGDGYNGMKEPAEIWSAHDFFPGSNDAGCKAFLGVFNTVFMAGYATCQYFGGFLGDRIDLRYYLTVNLIGSATMIMMCFCVSQWVGIYSVAWYIFFWVLNAMFQGPIWPSILSLMNNWFGNSANRGLILGIWVSNHSLGNIIGSLLVAHFANYGYELGILVPAVMQIGIACIIFSGLVVSPQEVGLQLTEESSGSEKEPEEQKIALNQFSSSQPSEVTSAAPAIANDSEAKAIGFFQALRLPKVAVYTFSYACLKLVNYALFFWLPFYFNRRFQWAQADAAKLSIWYDIGGIIGAIFIGFLSDRLNRSGVLLGHLISSLPVIVIFTRLPNDKLINAGVLFIIGYFVFGSVSTISAAVAADLGRHPKLNGNKKAQATISGIMEGTGSWCAALGQLAIPLIEQKLGWSGVFYMLICCICLTSLGVGRMLYNDMKQWRMRRRNK